MLIAPSAALGHAPPIRRLRSPTQLLQLDTGGRIAASQPRMADGSKRSQKTSWGPPCGPCPIGFPPVQPYLQTPCQAASRLARSCDAARPTPSPPIPSQPWVLLPAGPGMPFRSPALAGCSAQQGPGHGMGASPAQLPLAGHPMGHEGTPRHWHEGAGASASPLPCRVGTLTATITA